MSWFSDVLKEIASGGKAKTQTFNESASTSARPASSSTTSTRATSAAPSTASTRSTGGGGGGGGGARSAARINTSQLFRSGAVTNPYTNQDDGARRDPVFFTETPQPNAGTRVATDPTSLSAAWQQETARTQADANEKRETRGNPWAFLFGERNGSTTAPSGVTSGDPLNPATPDNSFGAAWEQQTALTQGRPIDPSKYAWKDSSGKPITAGDSVASSEIGDSQQAFLDQALQRQRSQTRELSDDEFNALSSRQKAAVLANTQMIDAYRSENPTQAMSEFASSIGASSDLDSFLKLDRVIGQSILDKLDTSATVPVTVPYSAGVDASTQNVTPRTFMSLQESSRNAAEERTQLTQAQTLSDQMAARIAQSLGSTNIPGFGSTDRDAVVQNIYQAMIDPSANYSMEDLSADVANGNAAYGTDVSEAQVLQFVRNRADAADYAKQGGSAMSLDLYGTLPSTLDTAEIRKRYGL